MDPRVRGNNDGTLYLADWPEPPVAKQKSHGLFYYAALLVFVVFILGSLAVTAFFVFFLILAFL
ncbi:MAG: hypothetical protein ACXW1R_07560 [Halobacteriota archaeon]